MSKTALSRRVYLKRISQSVLLEIEILGWGRGVGKAKELGQSQIA